MHIYWGYMYPHSNWQDIYGILLHQISFTYSTMHIYWGYIYPSLQLTIDLWNNLTENKFNIEQNTHILRIHLWPHSNWQYAYGIPFHKISFTYSRIFIYWGYMYPHSNWQDIYGILLHQISFTYNRIHTYWGYFYPLHYSWQEVHGILVHQISFTYSRMNIYWGHIYPLHSNWYTPFENRCMEYHYTK